MALAGLIFAGIHYVLEIRKFSLRIKTTNDFKVTYLGLANYNDAMGSLPYPTRRIAPGNASSIGTWAEQDPTGKPILSWRFSIARFSEYSSYPNDDPNKPWNSPENNGWNSFGIWFVDDRTRPINPSDPASFHTKIMAITGPGTAFGDGLLERTKKLGEIDGDTILAVETANSGLHWMEPGDFDIRTMPRTINDKSGKGIASRHKTGFHVLFADATVWYLSNKTPFEELEKFFTVEGGKTHDRDAVLGTYRVSSVLGDF